MSLGQKLLVPRCPSVYTCMEVPVVVHFVYVYIVSLTIFFADGQSDNISSIPEHLCSISESGILQALSVDCQQDIARLQHAHTTGYASLLQIGDPDRVSLTMAACDTRNKRTIQVLILFC